MDLISGFQTTSSRQTMLQIPVDEPRIGEKPQDPQNGANKLDRRKGNRRREASRFAGLELPLEVRAGTASLNSFFFLGVRALLGRRKRRHLWRLGEGEEDAKKRGRGSEEKREIQFSSSLGKLFGVENPLARNESKKLKLHPWQYCLVFNSPPLNPHHTMHEISNTVGPIPKRPCMDCPHQKIGGCDKRSEAVRLDASLGAMLGAKRFVGVITKCHIMINHHSKPPVWIDQDKLHLVRSHDNVQVVALIMVSNDGPSKPRKQERHGFVHA
ncbi:hypothetical protein VNO77_03934 [Canavalia gladiata]|uniref:Uncharacterized protein n=1 Tax=Canavalia gladiata TaxID=3824 RepID=A0AAN9R8L2_CANGL